MKKILLTIIGLWCYLISFGQTPTQITTIPGVTYVYVGSLESEENSTMNSQKIVVKILGGSWFSDSNGESTYYISNRDGLSVKQTSLSSYSITTLMMKAYKNGPKVDFYLLSNPGIYTSYAVTSFSFGHGLTPGFVSITKTSSVPPGTEIELKIIPMLTANRDGNVGIGTATPNEKLAVNGNIRAKEIKVEATNWPDYVFKKDYQLMPLKEVEQHIQQHGHLPDVPTASQIETDGLSVSEMNKLMMKKIEELTLHLIEKDKLLLEQQSQIHTLVKKVQTIEKIISNEK